jgi:hypothetical protein
MKYAEESLEFIVSKGNVIGSVVGSKHDCAGACSLRELPGVKDAWVTLTRAVIEWKNGVIKMFQAPPPLHAAVGSFDLLAGAFPEGNYRLTPVAPSRRHTYVQEYRTKVPRKRKVINNTETTQKKTYHLR